MFYTAMICISVLSISCKGNVEQNQNIQSNDTSFVEPVLKTGAEQTTLYYPLLEGKKIGVVSNQTGMIGEVHLIDSLSNAGFQIIKIFAPEHGFRGFAEAGEKVGSETDEKTGIPLISLYGNHFKPTPEDMKSIDIMIFDIQDVGARFYTYISTMHYVMEACAELDIPLIILDRPNPNGFYVDGPVLQAGYESFVGMHPIPIVHGLTVGELAQMINGEGWLKNGIQCSLTVIPVSGYTHKTIYQLPIAPSPNLQSTEAMYLYPSLCLFEGTVMSVGRGTETPFEMYGHPNYPDKSFSFIPLSKPGFALNPLYLNETCYGQMLHDYAQHLIADPKLEIQWLLDSYRQLSIESAFFKINMFDKLTGSSIMRQMILEGKTEQEIRKSWQPQLDEFKQIRKKYLLYEDFE